MLTSRFETEDTDVRITTYNGAKITTYRNIKQAMLDRGREKGLPPGMMASGIGTFAIIGTTGLSSLRKAHCNLLGGQSTLPRLN